MPLVHMIPGILSRKSVVTVMYEQNVILQQNTFRSYHAFAFMSRPLCLGSNVSTVVNVSIVSSVSRVTTIVYVINL